ncbi:MAG TPA: hypothetical protein VGO87_02010, partial [Acidimicrobiia bacterium]
STLEALADRIARLERTLDDLRATLAAEGAPTAAPADRPAVAARPTPGGVPAGADGPGEATPAGRAGPRAALGALRKSGSGPAAKPAPPSPPPSGPAVSPPTPASSPAASAPAASDAGPPGDGEGPLTLDDVRAAWAKAVEGFRPRLKAMAKEAHPVRIDGDTVVLGLPPRFEKVHLPTITGEAATITAALADLLGRTVRISVVLDDDVVSPAASGPAEPPPSPDPGPGAGADALAAEMARPPQPAGGGRGVDSPVGLVIETFGASIESETVRE